MVLSFRSLVVYLTIVGASASVFRGGSTVVDAAMEAADDALLHARVGAGSGMEQEAFSAAVAQKNHGPHGHSHGHNPHGHDPHGHSPHGHSPFADSRRRRTHYERRRRCSAGEYKDEDADNCKDCSEGRFQPAPTSSDGKHDQTSCPECAAGRHQPNEGSASCDACAAGQYQSATGKTSCVLLRLCAVGQGESVAGSASTDHQCAACVVGSTYSNVKSADACERVSAPCASGMYRTALATAAADRTCSACAAGHFTASAGKMSCTPWRTCPASQGQSNAGSATVNRQCAACTEDATFSTANSGDACSAVTVCTANEYETAKPTLSSDRTCKTHSARCPQGQYTSEAPNGTADRTCTRITVCAAGKYETKAPGLSSDRVCTNCAAGSFKAGTGSAACVAWSTCAVGSGESAAGSATTDRGCQQCALGFAFSGSNSGAACTPVRALCGAGKFMDRSATVSSDFTCATCSAGQFKAAAGNEACAKWRTCTAGHGLLQEGSAVANRECAACVVGSTFSTSNDDSACEGVRAPCAVGMHTAFAATDASDLVCTACADGQFSATAGNSQCTAWQTCGAGSGLVTEGTRTANRQCAKCAAGTHFSPSDSADACTRCAAGHFTASEGLAICSPWAGSCAHGALVAQAQRTAHHHCGSCDDGYYLDGAKCLPFGGHCENGALAKQSARVIHNHCGSCGAGYYLSAKQCICAPGRYRNAAGATSCGPCSAGRFQPLPGQSACRSCALGFVAVTGSVACSKCSAGTFAGRGAAGCTPCGSNELFAPAGAESCATCGAGSRTHGGGGDGRTRSACSECDNKCCCNPRRHKSASTTCAMQKHRCERVYDKGGRPFCDSGPRCQLGHNPAHSCRQGAASCQECGGGAHTALFHSIRVFHPFSTKNVHKHRCSMISSSECACCDCTNSVTNEAAPLTTAAPAATTPPPTLFSFFGAPSP
jgi:hypothetical protein